MMRKKQQSSKPLHQGRPPTEGFPATAAGANNSKYASKGRDASNSKIFRNIIHIICSRITLRTEDMLAEEERLQQKGCQQQQAPAAEGMPATAGSRHQKV
jgi:hypothetical protein